MLSITSRRRELQVVGGYKDWVTLDESENLNAANTLVVVIDAWNEPSNFDARIPNLESFLTTMRSLGSVICFSLYDTNIYADHPCRLRIKNSISGISIPLPTRSSLKNIPRPVKVPSGQGKDSETYFSILGRKVATTTPGAKDYTLHGGLTIDEDQDVISLKIEECIKYFSFLGRSLDNVVFCGKHINWCLLNRSIGVEEWKRRGFANLYIKRDCTISTNIPDAPPYCSQTEIDNLHFRYVESYWAKTF